MDMFDVVVIGGGINGCGIARDAAGRGLSVLCVEKGDLAQATSSASTKLIHGGLRYLEQYDFKLVRDSLNERETLLKSAPHIIWPMRFILPHEKHLRPRWLIRLGLYLYDFLGTRKILDSSKAFSFKQDKAAGTPLKESYSHGFSYTDCWVEDARLVVLCAMDAKERGAKIKTHTKCEDLRINPKTKQWTLTLHDTVKNKSFEVQAKSVVNAAGPWVRKILDDNSLAHSKTSGLRHSRGSHIVIPKLYDGDHAYILQQPDKRIVFAIPYEGDFTLIGTTDSIYEGSLDKIEISKDEKAYLCAAASRSFNTEITEDMIVWHYSGVRGLLDSGDENLSEVTRDYKLDLDTSHGAPLLNIFGGKLTTFRTLSQSAVDSLTKALGNTRKPWTASGILPGGDIPNHDFETFVETQSKTYPSIDPKLITRYARAYGTRMDTLIGDPANLGEHLGDDIYEAELRYGVTHEWVRSPEDFLWRRSKKGLHISPETKKNIEAALPKYLEEILDD